MEKKWITTTQAAELAGVTSETIRNLCNNGVLSYKKRYHLFYVNKDEVLKNAEQFSEIHEATKSADEYVKEVKDLRDKVYSELRELKESIRRERLDYGYTVSHIAALSYFAHRVMNVLSKDYAKEFTTMDIDIINNYLKNGCIFDPSNMVSRSRAHIIFTKFFHKLVSVKRELEVKDTKIQKLSENNTQLLEALKVKKRQVEVLSVAVKNGVIKEDIGTDVDLEVSDFCVHESLREKLLDFDFSVRCLNCLKAAEIETIEDLVKYRRNDLLKFRNFGKKSLVELDEFLEQHKLRWSMTDEEILTYSIKQLKLERAKLC